MSFQASNPFVWDRPFAFLWLTPDEFNTDHQELLQEVDDLARKTTLILDRQNQGQISSPMDAETLSFTPHLTLHTTYIDPSDVFGSLENMISHAAKLSSEIDPSASNMRLKLSSPTSGTTYFKSVYMDVDSSSSDWKALHTLKQKSIELIGTNVPPENQYLPHISLWYGSNPELRQSALKNSQEGVFAKGREIRAPYLHVVYAPFEDVRSWKIVGTSRLGTGVVLRRSGYIDGQYEAVRNAEKKHFSDLPVLLPITNPANGLPLAYFEGADQVVADRAIEAAHNASKSWAATPLAQRTAIIRKLVQLLRKKKQYLMKMETLDNGKPLKEAEADMNDVADCFAYYADLAESDPKLNGQGEAPINTGDPLLRSVVEYDPVGVCVMILPFNYPLLMAAWKVAPALVAGCTVVVKPSEITSATTMELAALAHAAGLPPGVLNVLPGLGPSIGPAITGSPLVRKIAFTGSGVTGKSILQTSTRLLPNVSLELGGKSPAILFSDADIDTALDWLLLGIFFNSGQVCSATSRLLVHASVYDQVKQKLSTAANKLSETRVGDGQDPNTLMGPLVSETQLKRVEKMVRQGMSQGAKLVVGERNFDKNSKQGYFWYPTILEEVNDENVLWNEEVFGPVLVMRKFDTEEEAIAMANNSRFGLAAAVFTKDEDRQRRCSRSLEAGIVWVNCSQPTLVQAPWGGMKESGIGRELGPFGLYNFLEPKQITSYSISNNWGWYNTL